MKFSPQTNSIVEGHEPALSNAIAATCDAVYLGNATGVFIIVHEIFAVDANHLVMTLREGATEDIAEAGTHAVTAEWIGWSNVTAQTNDNITALAAAATFTLDGADAANHCIWIFYVPASMLTSGRPWLHPTFAAGDGGNTASVLYILDGMRYKSKQPPTAV